MLHEVVQYENKASVTLCGVSEAAEEMRKFSARAANDSFKILLRGETGVGKDLLAEYIHGIRCGQGQKSPFVSINCAAVPEALQEAMLFGHGDEAYTGARTKRKGLVQAANGGILFLNQLSSMSLGLQGKLLSLVEGKPYSPVGETYELRLNARIISASNANLEKAIDEGKFRSDLYYRLNEVTFMIVPLRERRDDVRVLADRFLQQKNPAKRFSAEAMRLLIEHAWLGNVRELMNVVSSAVFTSHDSVEILPQHLALSQTRVGRAPQTTQGYPELDVPDSPSEGLRHADGTLFSLRETERAQILAVLDRTGGNKRRAADILGISLKGMYNKVRDYQIESPGSRGFHKE